MAVNTTEELVAGIIQDDVSSVDLIPFIASANMLVTKACPDTVYSVEELELIERWLAAHFYKIYDMARDTERAGPVMESYQYKLGLNLSVTMYGQQALALDYNGGLAVISKQAELGRRPTVGVYWLGTEIEDIWSYIPDED
jgi:hypothetical protein